MSNLLFMDESNGNGVYATKFNGTATTITTNTTATTTATTNNITNMMSATTTTAANGHAVAVAAAGTTTLPNSLSSEDLSQSLSEYTDADESISAPTEFLAEFLSAVMLKDYKKALKYCKLILQYEPNNATAKEFYPLILDKLRATFYAVATSSDSDENYNKSSSPELVLPFLDPLAGDSDEAAYDDQQQADDLNDCCLDEYGMPVGNFSGEANSHDSLVCCISSSSDSAGESLSVSVDEEDEEDDEVDDVGIDDEDDEDDGEEEEEDEEEDEINSSSGDDLPNDAEQHLLRAGDARNGIVGNNSNSSSGADGRSGSDNTTHSYSSLLLEEEDDIVSVNLQFSKDLAMSDLDVSNGNKIPSTSCSDSESPTEPLTQRLAAILRSKCGVGGNADN